MKKLLLLLLLSTAWLRLSAAPDDALFSALLGAHVVSGVVDYEALKDDPRLDQYLDQIAVTDPASLADDKARIALWINAYNAYTLRLVADNLPLKSIRDLGKGGKYLSVVLKSTPWDRRIARIGGRTYSLNEIEHEILRKDFSEPRIHFALVCAAVSCPPLRSEAYTAARLDEQFRDQARTFLLDRSKNRYDPKTNTQYLSKIFDWFGEDFAKDETGLISYLETFVTTEERTGSPTPPAETPSVRFLDYDWSLNDK